jgi:purine-binding chemotaxis protein CheW
MGSTNGGHNGPVFKNQLFSLQLAEAETENILTRRAAVLAQAPTEHDDVKTINKYLTVRLGSELYAVEVRYVKEIRPLKELTLIPCTPTFIAGAVNVRGSILPVLDIKKFFNIATAGIVDLNKIIVVEVDDIQVGLLADGVDEVMDVDTADIDLELANLSGVHEEFIRGVVGADIVVLDIRALVSDRRMVIHEDV